VLSSPTMTLTAATVGEPVVDEIATFTDANPVPLVSDFTASINWGDGTVTAGGIGAWSGTIHVFAPSGGHAYAGQGSFTVSVTLTKSADATVTSTATGTVVVTAPTQPPTEGPPTGPPSLSPPPDAFNVQGLWWNAPAGSESGWGINFAHQGDIVFATWFTYDATGKPRWLTMTANKIWESTYTGVLYQAHGPAFSEVPFNPGQVTVKAVGYGMLTFTGGSAGAFTYTIDGVSQTKAITREVFGTLPTCTFDAPANLTQATNYQDLWWAKPAASESGWGIYLAHEGDAIVATWFTYDVDGAPMWLIMTAPKSAADIYTGDLYRTTGPAYDSAPFDPSKVVATKVGTATLTFTDGNNATFAYTVDGVSLAKPITRQLLAPPAGTVCQ